MYLSRKNAIIYLFTYLLMRACMHARSFTRERKSLPGKGKCMDKGRTVIMESQGNGSWDMRHPFMVRV